MTKLQGEQYARQCDETLSNRYRELECEVSSHDLRATILPGIHRNWAMNQEWNGQNLVSLSDFMFFGSHPLDVCRDRLSPMRRLLLMGSNARDCIFDKHSCFWQTDDRLDGYPPQFLWGREDLNEDHVAAGCSVFIDAVDQVHFPRAGLLGRPQIAHTMELIQMQDVVGLSIIHQPTDRLTVRDSWSTVTLGTCRCPGVIQNTGWSSLLLTTEDIESALPIPRERKESGLSETLQMWAVDGDRGGQEDPMLQSDVLLR